MLSPNYCVKKHESNWNVLNISFLIVSFLFIFFISVAKTPVNTVSIKELPRSSSGRMIKPPLAYWTNQRIRSNVSTDIVEIIAGGTNYLPHNVSDKKLSGSTELTPVR